MKTVSKTLIQKKQNYKFLFSQKNNFLQQQEIFQLSNLSQCKKHDFLSGRYLLKKLFSHLFSTPLLHSEIGIDNQKIYIENIHTHKRYFASLSHSTHYISGIISAEKSVGIDIEEPKIRHIEFEKNILSFTEKNILFQLYPLKEFSGFLPTFSWVIKEAVFKADNTNLSIFDYRIIQKKGTIILVQNSVSFQVFSVQYSINKYFIAAYTV